MRSNPRDLRHIGMIYPSGGLAESEFYKLAPAGVEVHTTRIPFEIESIEALLRMDEDAIAAAKLLAMAKPDVILFNCTTGSLVKGAGYDRELIGRIETVSGSKATTTATACVQAMQHLGMSRVCMVAPYPDDVIERERKFLEAHGVRVARVGGEVILDPREQAAMEPEYWFVKAQEAWDGESDGLFISCAGIRVCDLIGRIEKLIGRPVVASNQAAMWACLRLMEMNRNVSGFGRLLSEVA